MKEVFTLELTRNQICDLRIACTAIAQDLEKEGRTCKKWDALHEILVAAMNNQEKEN